MEIRRVAVVGAGTIGASWAANFLARGLEVAASDPAPEGEAVRPPHSSSAPGRRCSASASSSRARAPTG